MSRNQLPWYVDFFGSEDYKSIYESRLSDYASTHEAQFVERVLGLKRGDKVLDLVCGHGRHAIPLAKHGIDVTGLDLNADYLDQAQRSAKAAGVSIETVHSDMRQIPHTNEFDAVINMFTAFGYFDTDAENAKVLRSVATALKPGHPLLMDLLNREWVVSNYIQNEWHDDGTGTLYIEHRELDLASSRNRVSFTVVEPDGTRRDVKGHDIRLYTLKEIIDMLGDAGLEYEKVYGGYNKEPYNIDTRRMILVARKPY